LADERSAKVRPKARTEKWAPPEVISNEPIAKVMLPRIDIYSAGVVFATLFLGGDHPFKAHAPSISSTATEADVMELLKRNSGIQPLNLARQALAKQDFVTELQPGFMVNLGSCYCDWELERIGNLLEHTYVENPASRLGSGRELVKFLRSIWQPRTWNSHRERCSGTIARSEVAKRRYQMEVFTEGHSEPAPPPEKCPGPKW
jgi:serine/threonine protein kinase